MNSSGPKRGARVEALARDAWARMFQFLMLSAPARARSLGRRGLTPNDSRALSALDQGVGRSMRELADEWECDPSNATWIVDRLERMGLAQREGIPGDRRVKLVVLTAKGARLRDELMEEFLTPPAELFELNQAQLRALRRAVKALPRLVDLEE
jgi:DNA-binding MarR family transcriptional regulator